MSTNATISNVSERILPAPEAYTLPPTEYVPNSPMPYLVYRNVLPLPVTETSCQEFIEQHGWTRLGPVWKAQPKRHFHPNVHECYGIIRGSSHVLMGLGTSDDAQGREPGDPDTRKPGLRIMLHAGDVVVHPAGTSHSNMTWEDEYCYLSFFPEGAPRWRSENGTKIMDIVEMRRETLAAPLPEDPVIGGEGYLKPLWRSAKEEFFDAQRV
ncbi:hypothetical protein B0T10DRAFT_533290 [Thelonectria olida]|uniref:Cupin type-1 domain-containing protein n=1 Tax=Thelonectria olida TaxID=1576542 RepID=A0A9P8VUE2_9HYPO|nr:hypothetical protein B0T10DRAFT_533290 [Thelonectria olida]